MLPALPHLALYANALEGVSFDVGSLITGGGFAGLVWYLITRAIPKMQEEFTEALASERAAFTNELKSEREQRHKIANEFNQSVLRMVALGFRIDPREAAAIVNQADLAVAAQRRQDAAPEKT